MKLTINGTSDAEYKSVANANLGLLMAIITSFISIMLRFMS